MNSNPKLSYAITAGGDPSSNADATINVPVIPDTLALRGVIYDETRGGYIDNIPGTFSRAATDEVSCNSPSAHSTSSLAASNSTSLIAGCAPPAPNRCVSRFSGKDWNSGGTMNHGWDL